MNIDLTLSKSPVLFFIAVAFLLILSFWTYRHTLPPIPKKYRYSLLTLRTAALILILFSLFEPVLTLHSRQNQKSHVGLLIDNSSSMEIKEGDKSRKEKLWEILRSKEIEKLKNKYALEFYAFSDHVDQISEKGIDSLRFDGHATDIGSALKQLQDKSDNAHFRGVLLLSDGVQNQGETILRIGKNLDFPIFSVAIGKTEPKNDVILTEVTTNEITYVDNRVPVDIHLRGPGYEGKKVEIQLEMNDTIVDKKTVPIPADNMEIDTRLYFQPSMPGFHKIVARVPKLEGEFTDKNNYRDLVIRVLKNRLQVYLFSRAPGPDHAFLVRSLESDKNVHLTIRTQMRNGAFYEGILPPEPELKKADVFVFLDFPDSHTQQGAWQHIKTVLQISKIPLFLFSGKFLEDNKLQGIESVFSCHLNRIPKEIAVLPSITKDGEGHSLLKILENEQENRKIWEQLPPIYTSWTSTKTLPENRILLASIPEKASFPSQEKFPLFIIKQMGEQKSLIFTGYGFYRWDLLVKENWQNENMMDHLLSQSLRWLSTPDAGKTVRLDLPKTVYSAGEPIKITAEVYDEMYTPVENAVLDLKLTAPSSESALQSVNMGNGRYLTSYRAHEAGTYRIVCEAFVRNRLVGKDTTEFSVTSFNLEFLDTHANPELLLSLAEMTGGKSGPPDSLAEIVQTMNFPSRHAVSAREIELYNLPLILVIIIVLLSLEWFARKRKGMV